MDKITTIQELKEKVQAFCEQRDWDQFHNPKELAIGISTEANELLQIFRFKSEADMQSLMASDKKQKVEEELADVLMYYNDVMLCYGITADELKQVYVEKFAKNMSRW